MDRPLTRGVMFQYFEWNYRSDGSLWRDLASRARELKKLGTTSVWLPPAYKGAAGVNEVGYGVYDMYDLGEFDQKGTVRTKYGTKDEFIAAVKAVRDAGMQAYADIVLNHRVGGDETEEVEIVEVDPNDRNKVVSDPYKIKAWSHYAFEGRGGKYSPFHWRAAHFNAFGSNAGKPDEKGKIYRVKDKSFSGEVSFEKGNFDYLMGANVDHYNPEVREDLFRFGRWLVRTTGVDGFRLDAIKHIPAGFMKDWLEHVRAGCPDRELFAVGEYWSGDLAALRGYMDRTQGVMSLMDVPLHFKFCDACRRGRDFDLSKIFDNTYVRDNALKAVTFVDNHDSQPGGGLASCVDDWFKPLAYALILLRREGYPCVFFGDYFGSNASAQGGNKLISHRQFIDHCLSARSTHAFGQQEDYFDHPNCIGWVWTGDEDHRAPLVVLMSTGEAGQKRMQTHRPRQTFRDITGHWPEPIATDESGYAEFRCQGGSASIWVAD